MEKEIIDLINNIDLLDVDYDVIESGLNLMLGRVDTLLNIEVGESVDERVDVKIMENTLNSNDMIGKLLANHPQISVIFEDLISSNEDEFEPEMFEIAKDEIDEKKQEILNILDNVAEGVDIDSNLEEIKRHLHTLKGSLRMAGLNKMGAVTHRLESLLDYAEVHSLRLGDVKPIIDDEFNKLLYLENNRLNLPENIDWIDRLLGVTTKIESVDEVKIEDAGDVKVAVDVIGKKKVDLKPVEDKQSAKIGLRSLDGLFNDAADIRMHSVTLGGSLGSSRDAIKSMSAAHLKMSDLLREIEMQAETKFAVSKIEDHHGNEDFDPLEFDRYTRLQELARFTREALDDIKEGIDDIEKINKVQENSIVHQNISNNNILESIMKVRLISVDSLNERLYRISRNTAKELGKQLVLEISGEKTEIDRFVLDKVYDPLSHILRNCIAHGIETPEQRELIGKSKIGRVNLDIKQEGNFITLRVSDDGAGINLKKVRQKGIEKGLISDSDVLDDDQLIELIYRAGFSTVDAISQVSGRGVGMDVVKNDISSLGGTVITETVEGKGSVFSIIIPVSVATNQVLISTTLGKLIAIPAVLVESAISVKEDEMLSAYRDGYVFINNEKIPLSYMGHLIGMVEAFTNPVIADFNNIVIVSHGTKRAAIHIDRLETTDDILIKSVGQYFSKVQGVLGATLLGDGRQGLVVNPILLKEGVGDRVITNNISSNVEIKKEERGSIKVLVVDDAKTVRKVMEKSLLKYGFDVDLAVDGSDALSKIRERKPDIILSDIEMPVMDGFEFLRNIKLSEQYKNIPVIMITSRTADKHSEKAFGLGCSAFFGKPYVEDELIAKIKSLIVTE